MGELETVAGETQQEQIPGLEAEGCFLALFMSLKLILRRMLPRKFFIKGLFLPLASASSFFTFSALGFTMGGLD